MTTKVLWEITGSRVYVCVCVSVLGLFPCFMLRKEQHIGIESYSTGLHARTHYTFLNVHLRVHHLS